MLYFVPRDHCDINKEIQREEAQPNNVPAYILLDKN